MSKEAIWLSNGGRHFEVGLHDQDLIKRLKGEGFEEIEAPEFEAEQSDADPDQGDTDPFADDSDLDKTAGQEQGDSDPDKETPESVRAELENLTVRELLQTPAAEKLGLKEGKKSVLIDAIVAELFAQE